MFNVVAESLDGSSLLLGSVKWQKQGSRAVAWAELERQAARFPDAQGRQVLLCLFPQKPTKQDLGPEQVLQALR